MRDCFLRVLTAFDLNDVDVLARLRQCSIEFCCTIGALDRIVVKQHFMEVLEL